MISQTLGVSVLQYKLFNYEPFWRKIHSQYYWFRPLARTIDVTLRAQTHFS